MNVSITSDVPQKSDPADAAVGLDGDPDVRQLPVRLDLGHEEVVAVRTQLLRLQDLDRPGLGHLQRSGGLRFELLPFDGDRIREVALEVVGVDDDGRDDARHAELEDGPLAADELLQEQAGLTCSTKKLHQPSGET